jgi:hypothetical protein
MDKRPLSWVWKAVFLAILVPYPAFSADRDCNDFQTWEQAQRYFHLRGLQDPDNLDADKDGIACEVLQPVGIWNLKSICQGRDLQAIVQIKYSGLLHYSVQISNNHGEHAKAKARYRETDGVLLVDSFWQNGTHTQARAIVSKDGQTIRGKDSFNCEFIAYRR